MLPSHLIARSVIWVEPTCTIADAARLMMKRSVGCLVICEGSDRRPLGLVTDRDLVAAIADGLNPERATVTTLPRAPLCTVSCDAELADATLAMAERGIRRLPVVDGGTLVGILSYDDVVAELARELSDLSSGIARQLAREPIQQAKRHTGGSDWNAVYVEDRTNADPTVDRYAPEPSASKAAPWRTLADA